MTFNQERQGIPQDTAWLPKVANLTINNLPDELLVEIFDFYRQDKPDNVSDYHWWSIKLEWFKLIHVCKRWRTVVFASSSRLDLCFVLPKTGGHMKTILSRHFPPLPIDIRTNRAILANQAKDVARIYSALKHPDRIRRVSFIETTTVLDKLLKAIKFPLPALESLELRDKYDRALKIPATFLKGSYLHLRTLKLHPIRVSLPTISRLLSSVPALTCLCLLIDTNVASGPPPAMLLLLSHLQGMPCLRRLDLELTRFFGEPSQPTNSKENFTLSNLTSFRYRGHSAFLNTLIAGFTAPSLRDIFIRLHDMILSPIPHLSRFIEDTKEHCRAVQVDLEQASFRLLLLGPGPFEYAGHDSLHFTLSSPLSPESMTQMSSAFYSKLITTEELTVNFLDDADAEEEVIPWRRFFLQFPRVKALRMYGTNNRRVASALHQDYGEHNLAILPALEEIELCMSSSSTSEDHASELAIFEPFVSARQQAGLPVKVVTDM
ncbi:hypothetical protein DFH94DRAFT_337870 [Russula ochroleuca]|uniref:F-box domain-containing protein n=1 Tax=Russula ochroleuca TaxID=152965 RepID=A0A9P5TBV8_9AGAM|nr:hypothetical protein DFH94DRAFT_337870 [Russula ochroleuca]